MMEDLDQPIAQTSADEAVTTADATTDASVSVGPRAPVTPREWVSPGVSLRKRILTGIGVALVAILFFFIAVHEGASALVSTIIGVIFIGGFVGYLRVVAPTPFTLRLDEHGVTRTDHGAEPQRITWDAIARVKEEVFKSGVTVSVTVYKRVGAKGLHRAWVVYRDDIPQFDAFVEAFSAAVPLDRPWTRETVHE
ncbi:MAG TPA: hypothetical protein VE338_12725 [Ktedonobacterales bacterium]|jgi:hypothetical protein|nr:hypothetical protein [Ktedonobacterales bacterium]